MQSPALRASLLRPLFAVAGLLAFALSPACSCQAQQPGAQACDSRNPCPGSEVCGADGFCHAPGGDGGSIVSDSGGCVSDAGAGCQAGQLCLYGTCITPIACTTDDDCQNDSYCDSASHFCVPYGFGPRGSENASCQRIVAGELFSPAVQCDWPPAAEVSAGTLVDPTSVQVLSTPDVADFNFTASLETLHPSIVFVSYAGLDGSCGELSGGGVIRIIDGRTCATNYTIDSPPVLGASTPAIGDLTGDRRPEIVALALDGGLVAFTFDTSSASWKLLWHSHDSAGKPLTPAAGLCLWVAPSIYDINDDGKPEVLLGGEVFDETGQLLDDSLGLYHDNSVGQFAVAADVNADGVVELVMDDAYYTWDSTMNKWSKVQTYSPAATGFVAVGDFGTYAGTSASGWDRSKLDGLAELAVVGKGLARIYNLSGVEVFSATLPSSTGGGPPTIGDFDGDGRAELAAAGSDSYTIFDPDCAGTVDPKYCDTTRTDGILWTKPSQDHSSNITGSSLFDFSGDGKEEAIYADECYVRVYDGSTGEVLFSQPHSSCTWTENPVVADVQGTFRSKLLVPSNENCNTASTCPKVDPDFPGMRCAADPDCPSGISCMAGLCRCTSDAECNPAGSGGGFSCLPAPAGTSGSGDTCQAYNGGVGRHGLRIFADVLDRWASSRPIWNQHTYAITEVDDDGTVSKSSSWLRNWTVTGYNNFRAQVQGKGTPGSAPDLTAHPEPIAVCNADGSLSLTVDVCDRGTAPVGDGLDVAFYDGDPKAGGTLLCVAMTTSILSPGSCTAATCLWKSGPGTTPTTLYAVADDDGTGKPQYVECDPGNNEAILPGVTCGVK